MIKIGVRSTVAASLVKATGCLDEQFYFLLEVFNVEASAICLPGYEGEDAGSDEAHMR